MTFSKKEIWGIDREEFYQIEDVDNNLHILLVEVELRVLRANRTNTSNLYRNSSLPFKETDYLGKLIGEIDKKISHRESKLRDLLKYRG